MFLFCSVVYNLLLSLFWCSDCPRPVQQQPLQADSCVLLTGSHHSLNTSLISDAKYIPELSCTFPAPALNQSFLQGDLLPFSGEWYLRARCAPCYCDIADPRVSHWTELTSIYVYYFPTVAVTGYHKHSGFKTTWTHHLSVLEIRSPKMSAGLHSFWRL